MTRIATLALLAGCSFTLDGEGITVGDNSKSGDCEEFSCTPSASAWLVDSSHNTSYAFLDYCWACQDNPVDNPFQLDVGIAGTPDDWEQYFPGSPTADEIYALLAPSGDVWEASGADVVLREATGRLHGRYGQKDGSSSLSPNAGYESGGSYAPDTLMTADCHSPTKAGPVECDIVAYAQYIDGSGSAATIKWNYSTTAPGKTQASFASALRHEYGHVLGIDDNDIASSLMYEGLAPGEFRGLSADDIEAAVWLYGASSSECR